MNRRTLLAAVIAFSLAPFAASALEPDDGLTTLDYKPGLIEELLAEGKTLFVDYKASWCGACKRQGRVISSLRKANPAYDEAMTFINVDWDTYLADEVTLFRNVPRRSTLIVLRNGSGGEEELGRVVAGTSEEEIKALLDKGL